MGIENSNRANLDSINALNDRQKEFQIGATKFQNRLEVIKTKLEAEFNEKIKGLSQKVDLNWKMSSDNNKILSETLVQFNRQKSIFAEEQQEF